MLCESVKHNAFLAGCCPAILEPCSDALLRGEMRLHRFCMEVAQMVGEEVLELCCAALLTAQVQQSAADDAQRAMAEQRALGRRRRAEEGAI